LSGIAVFAERGVLLHFDLSGRWNGYFLSNTHSGYNWFSTDGEWYGYLLGNSEKGFNLFSKEGKWLGFLN
jgi:hypothetical protein